MEVNYFDQLIRNYPEDAELLKWLNIKLDRNIYFYGPNFKFAQGTIPNQGLKGFLRKCYYFYKGIKCSYEGAVICDAYFNVGMYIKQEGYKVELPPWLTYNLSKEGMDTAEKLSIRSTYKFKDLISQDFKKKVYNLKEEIKQFLIKNHTPFVLFANGEQPIYRITIDACKEINVPTGVFLHGLPARYSFNDNYQPDYLFVWGEKIKMNFESIGVPSKVIVTGHPVLSQYNKKRNSNSNIVVLTQSINFTSCSQHYVLTDAGLTIQYIYAVEKVLKSLGYEKAILRPHPSENLSWYRERMDNDFYTLDTAPLEETIANAKFFVGSISTVILNAVYSSIPYYVYIVDPTTNRNTLPTVPPFTSVSNMPVGHTEEELLYNIKNGLSVKSNHFDGYIKEKFDISKITELFIF